MMLRLRTKKSVLNGEKFLNDIMGENRDNKKNPFELVSLNDVDEADEISIQDRIERLIKEVCRIKMMAEVEHAGERFDIHITAKIDRNTDGVWIRPLRNKKGSRILSEIHFDNLELLQLP